MWKAGFRTVQSCQQHAATGKVWLQLLAAHQAEDFLNIVAPYEGSPQSIYRRARHWYFGMYELVSGSLAPVFPAEVRQKIVYGMHGSSPYGS